ncbi:LysR substrate-binding domain-containing protein [Rhizobacter sp. SG703]|uniref:LysR substrate-binding domain-containing protein n=1 Tax=Rhizobacter sp. SG703 TaxID=2587140 RepID=UPI0014465B6D|nr:DNA-binding transcriptional LysR family regulator [Rhizobacter sp. SG703]
MNTDQLRYPSIDGLRAFECAARLGSFERAADELHVSASAIGKRIATLEELLGTVLLTRSARALALTPAGKEYLPQVAAALALLAAVPLHQRSAQRTQRLRITAPPTFARQILVPALQRFTRAHPQVELEIALSIPFLDVAGAESDIEVRHLDGEAAEGQLLMRDVAMAMAAPSLIERLPPLRTPADLADAPLLRTPIEPWTPWFRAAGLDWGEPAQGTKLVDLGLTLEAAAGGQGVALARPSLARPWLTSGALRPLFALAITPSRQYRLLPHGDEGAAPAFAQWLRETCDEIATAALAEARGLVAERLSG